MESNNELKGTDIKSLMCYYLMKLGHISFENISLDKKSYKN